MTVMLRYFDDPVSPREGQTSQSKTADCSLRLFSENREQRSDVHHGGWHILQNHRGIAGFKST